MFVYELTEPQVWTVGHYTPDGEWQSESDHATPEAAARRCILLNGGRDGPEWSALMERARNCREKKFTHYGEEIRLAECDDVLDDILAYLGEQP